MLDRVALKAYCESFYGYGDASAPHWFISMEEGGGSSEEEIATRISAWEARGRRELEDLPDYHRAIGINKWSSDYPPLQKTWYASIRILLILAGESPDIERSRRFQRGDLGRNIGNNRLSPLFPLPARSIDDWNYCAWVGDEQYSNRASYRRHLEKLRTEHLRNGIETTKPRTVVFYGQSYRDYWRQIAGVTFERCRDDWEVGSNGSTQFVICRHPAAQGVANEYFNAIGRFLLGSEAPVSPSPTRHAAVQLPPAETRPSESHAMSHLCEQLVAAAKYLESKGMTTRQLSKLHHFSLKGREVTFQEAYRYFGTRKELGKTNADYAERLRFVADNHKLGRESFSSLIEQALRKWPLGAK